jgi:hypothetical protein
VWVPVPQTLPDYNKRTQNLWTKNKNPHDKTHGKHKNND